MKWITVANFLKRQLGPDKLSSLKVVLPSFSWQNICLCVRDFFLFFLKIRCCFPKTEQPPSVPNQFYFLHPPFLAGALISMTLAFLLAITV